MTLLRSVIIGVLAVAVARLLRTLLADRRHAVQRAAWVLLLAPYFTPVLLTGYAYANFSLSLIHHPELNVIFYSALLWWKFTPVAAVILYFTPAPISAEAIHCWRLAQDATPSRPHPEPGPDRGCVEDQPQRRARCESGEVRESQGRPSAAAGALSPRTQPRSGSGVPCANISEKSHPGPATKAGSPRPREREKLFPRLGEFYAFLFRAGCAGGPVAAFAVVFLCTFAEFEMASLMVVKSWTVALFDAHAGGLALSESLRRMAGPLLCEAAAIATVFVVLGRRQVVPARPIEGSRAGRWLAWCHLAIAFIFVLMVPAAMVLWGTIRGIGLLLENFVLGREILASLLFATGASGLAGLTVFWPGAAARGRSLGSNLCKVALVVAVFAGLLGPLVLSLTVLAAVQLPGLISLRDTPVPLVFTLGLVLLPMALVFQRVLELTRRRSALHLATLLDKTRAARELTWRLGASGKFWAMVLLFVWAYWDLTASAILAPIGMTPVTVRLYNLMHYGQIAALSAMTCAAFAAPILIFLLALGTRRWWAPS